MLRKFEVFPAGKCHPSTNPRLTAKCDNAGCAHEGPAATFTWPPKDYLLRVHPEDPTPVGECPKCGDFGRLKPGQTDTKSAALVVAQLRYIPHDGRSGPVLSNHGDEWYGARYVLVDLTELQKLTTAVTAMAGLTEYDTAEVLFPLGATAALFGASAIRDEKLCKKFDRVVSRVGWTTIPEIHLRGVAFANAPDASVRVTFKLPTVFTVQMTTTTGTVVSPKLDLAQVFNPWPD